MSFSAAASRNGPLTRAEKARRCTGLELDAAMWSTLDDHLQEKIISRLPFRSLYQLAPSLSKTWRLRFGSASFQREIESSATSWTSYGPLLSYLDFGIPQLFGYDICSERWCRLPTHSYLPRDMEWRWDVRAGNGSLLCWVGHSIGGSSSLVPILVTNALSRSWRILPPRPDMMMNNRTVHVVLEVSSEVYKVILGSLEVEDLRYCLCFKIFDSTDGSWMKKSYSVGGTAEEAFCHGIVVRDGVLYSLVRTGRAWHVIGAKNKYKMICLDTRERALEESPLQVVGQDEKTILPRRRALIRFSDLLLCGSNLMVVMFHGEVAPHDALSVCMLDLDRGLVIEVSRSPKKWLLDIFLDVVTCHGDFVYIGSRLLKSEVVCYNVGTREWVCFQMGTRPQGFAYNWHCRWITYQPGSNPFLKV